jgi:hypothetical protein
MVRRPVHSTQPLINTRKLVQLGWVKHAENPWSKIANDGTISSIVDPPFEFDSYEGHFLLFLALLERSKMQNSSLG